MTLYTIEGTWQLDETGGDNTIAYFSSKEKAQEALDKIKQYYGSNDVILKDYSQVWYHITKIEMNIDKFDVNMIISKDRVLEEVKEEKLPEYTEDNFIYFGWE